MLQAFIALLSSLPTILKLIQTLQAQIKQEQINGTVKDNVKMVHEAFVSKDASKLNDVFNK